MDDLASFTHNARQMSPVRYQSSADSQQLEQSLEIQQFKNTNYKNKTDLKKTLLWSNVKIGAIETTQRRHG